MLYRVANLPFEKVRKIENFEEANFGDFKQLVVTLKLTHRSIIGLKRLVNPSKINFQAQTGGLL